MFMLRFIHCLNMFDQVGWYFSSFFFFSRLVVGASIVEDLFVVLVVFRRVLLGICPKFVQLLRSKLKLNLCQLTMLTLLSSMAMAIAAADDASSMLQKQAVMRDIKSDVTANFSTPSDCLTRTNFHRVKWGLALMAENPSCLACVKDASCSNKLHGAHSSSNYGINCPMRAQNEGGGPTCAGVVDMWYNERYSCSYRSKL